MIWVLLLCWSAYVVLADGPSKRYNDGVARIGSLHFTNDSNTFISWTEAYAKAQSFVAKLTNDEKNAITTGISQGGLSALSPQNGCSGTSKGIKRLGYEGLCLQDGPAGVRGADLVNAYPSGIHLGASWNPSLIRQIGKYMGAEFKRKGAHVALGPVVGPLGRIARGGRNFEGYSNDPYLAGVLAAEMVQGLQESVIACIKHFVGNEQETNRMPDLMGITKSVSSNIDDRTMHELYMWPFQDTIRAGVASVMCSYNRVNNTYACENGKLMNDLLKTELGFQGFVVSDWLAQHAGVKSAIAGLDMVMPDEGYWNDNTLSKVVNSTALPQQRLDDMVTRIMAAYYKFIMDSPSYPRLGVGLPASLLKPHELVDGRDPAAKSTIFQAAVEGHVLVKNKNNTLPLKSPRLLSLFGFDAYAPLMNNPSNIPVSRWTLGANSLAESDLAFAASFATGINVPQIAEAGTLISGSGSGATTGSYISAPIHAFENQAYEDGTYLLWDFKSENPDVNPASEACMVFINEFAEEGADRPGLANAKADKLVVNVANKCRNTVVVIHNAGVRLVDAWIDHVNVTAVVFAHLPGQDSGRALIEVLYCKQSPSGRLSYTVARKESDYGNLLKPQEANFFEITNPQSNFSENLYIDYRAFMQNNIQPRFPFGYGLTYTTFAYSNLQVHWNNPTSSNESITLLPPASPIVEGGQESLFRETASVSCTITNTGGIKAAEVAQLYLGIPHAPSRQLRGFQKVFLEPNQSIRVTFNLTRRDMSIWGMKEQAWILQQGRYKIMVGASVLDIKVEGLLER